MTTKLKNIRRIVAASALLMLLGLVSCTNEVVTSHSSDSAKGEARQVRFALNTGGQAKTRATASSASEVAAQKRENIITKLYAVVFTPDATNQLTAGSFSKTYEVTLKDMVALNADIDNANQTYDEATFTMDEAGLYYMFLVANPGEALEKNLTNATGATNALTTAKTVTDFYGLVESDRNPNDNSATGFLMTSKMIQVDIKGDEETDLTGTDISLTRAAARFDIDASALGNDFVLTSVKFKNRHATTVVVNTGTDATETGTSSTSTTDPTYNKPASLPAATASMPADPATFLSAYVWKGGIYGYENHADAQTNVDGGTEANAGDGITQLIISGTYKGIAVSQTVDFWSMEEVAGNPGDPVTYTYTTIPINRNTIYTVKLLPKATPDQYAPFAYTIGVANWREGETIVYKGTDLAQPYKPELISIKKQLWDEDNNKWADATELNLSTVSLDVIDNGSARTVTDGKRASIGNKTCRLAIKVKTGTSGCNILCPELSETLADATGTYKTGVTAADKKGIFEGEQSNPDKTYDDDGNMYQTWYVQISEKNATSQSFNFTLTNQLNSQNDYITHFQVRLSINVDDLRYGDIVYDDCTIVHLGESKPTGEGAPNPIGVVVYNSDTPTAICEAGVTTSEGYIITGKALVVALKPCLKNGVNYALWSGESTSQNYNEDDLLFPNISSNHAAARADLRGYEKTKYLVEGCNGKGHTHPAAIMASTYHEQQLNLAKTDYLIGSTGWFLPSIGQWMYLMESCYQNGDKDGNKKHNDTLTWPWEAWYQNDHGPNFMSLLVTWAGGQYIGNHHWMSSEYDADQVHQPCHTSGSMSGSWWGQAGSYSGGFGQGGYKNANNYVRAVLAY